MAETRGGGKRVNCFQAKSSRVQLCLREGCAPGNSAAGRKAALCFIHLKSTDSSAQTPAASSFFSKQACLIWHFPGIKEGTQRRHLRLKREGKVITVRLCRVKFQGVSLHQMPSKGCKPFAGRGGERRG